ncbi:hypothetical protein WA026_019616 [Henosepilachna vigintioctopunctata]|uniref:C2H2-type domain-containing protein n=1 Tax=Henosepilachna vigintioctopunctata TaxID=420089 RepID=A0AAW1TMW5_9CUCU
MKAHRLLEKKPTGARKARNLKIKKRAEEIAQIKSAVQRYKKKVQRMKKPPIITPNTKVNSLVSSVSAADKETIKKKLLLSEVVTQQLNENFSNLTTNQEKRVFRRVLGEKIVKKYDVLSKEMKIKPLITINKKSRLLDIKRSSRKNCEKLKTSIAKFMEDESSSRICAGKKDFLTKKGGKRNLLEFSSFFIASELTIGKINYGPQEILVEVLGDEIPNGCSEEANLKKGEQKKHCCFYCMKLVFKVYLHYLSVHKNEEEVQEISILSTKSKKRLLLLASLRKKGDFIFNSQLKTDSENQIVCKDSVGRIKNVCCTICKGYYSKYSIRHHIRNSHPEMRKLGQRTNIQSECSKMETNIHQIASKDLRNRIFPYMRDDVVSNIVRSDEAIVHYGNYLCRKYTEDHHASEIRAHIRNFGKLILAIKESDPNHQNLLDILNAKYVNLIIDAIERVAGKDPQTGLNRAPSTEKSLGTELKKLCKLLQMEYVKSDDKEKQKQMKNLLLVFDSEFHVTVNKIGTETQKINNRRKKTVLPKTEDIAEFRKYLKVRIIHFTREMNEKFSKISWTRLAEYTLVHLAVFNRKRPSETERLLIDEYLNYDIVGDDELRDDDLLSREQIKKWARIKFTEHHSQQTLKACVLIRRISEESGIKDSQLIRTRLLRQNLATETANENVDQRLESRVSDFMSHQRKIHEDYYVMTKKADDITKVSTLLKNFSSTPKTKQIVPHSSIELKRIDSASSTSDEESISDIELTQAELNYVLGKKKNRSSWSSEEKK